MIRRLLIAGACVALTLVFSPTAEAQLNLRGLKLPAALQSVFLLRGEAVQTELNLNDEQKTALAELALQLQQDAFEIFSGLQDLTPEEQAEQMAEVNEMIADKGKEVQAKVDTILEDAQKKRLGELSLQARGAQALEDEELAAALKISDEQQAKLAEIRDEAATAMQEVIQGLRAGGGDQGEMRDKIAKLQKELGDKALAVLTAEQREQFEKLKGSEFKFPPQRGGGFF